MEIKDLKKQIVPRGKERVSFYLDSSLMKDIRKICSSVFDGAKVSHFVENILEDYVKRLKRKMEGDTK